jgi:putative salt-induced outer membrane protein YdiY
MLCLLVCLSTSAWGDEVEMTNGDRLTGSIVKMEDRLLTLQTDYGGELKIDWLKVRRLRADSPLKIWIPREPQHIVREFFLGSAVAQEVMELGPDSPIPLPDITAINLEPVRITGTITVGGNSTSGNSSTKAVNGAVRLALQAHRQRVLLEAKYNYGQAGEQLTARNSLVNLKHDFFVSKKVFIETFGMLEKDTFQNLQLRSTIGSGVGYQFYDSARTTLSTALGVAYVDEHFTTAPSSRTPSARWNVRWEHALWPDRVKVFHRHEGFYDLAAGNAVRVNADQGLRVTVYKNLFVNVEYDLRLNTQPAPGRQQVDQAYIFGVGYEIR